MPVVPLQRPEELHISNPSWMQNTSGYEDLNEEKGVPTLISWTYEGKDIAVEGSWDNWKSRFFKLDFIYSRFTLKKTILYFLRFKIAS